MKKIILVIIMVFFLTGCNNSIELDFTDDILTTINLSFNLNEYRQYADFTDEISLKSSIQAIIDNREAFVNGNDQLFKEIEYKNVNNNYVAKYTYTYNYSNFLDSSVLNTCFDSFLIEEDNENYYIQMKGESICAPFDLKVKAKDKIVSSNEDQKIQDTYIWNVKRDKNDIFMTISKKEINTKEEINLFNTVTFCTALLCFVGAILINKKIKRG